jgi:hypothetical protein
LDEIGGIPVDEKGKPKARYDQLAKFKSWLEAVHCSDASTLSTAVSTKITNNEASLPSWEARVDKVIAEL